MHGWRAPVCRALAIFVRFSCSMAKPCIYIIIDDSDHSTIASEQTQNGFAPAIWAFGQPDPQSCRLFEPLPAHGTQRDPGQKPVARLQTALPRPNRPLACLQINGLQIAASSTAGMTAHRECTHAR